VLNKIATTSAATGNSAANPIRVLIVDDSAVIRGLIARCLENEPEVEVVSTAANGQIALNYVTRNPVDVVVLDIEMPVMNGLEALPQIIAARPSVKVIMASTLTRRGAAISIEALSKGAADFVPKPTASRELVGTNAFSTELSEKVKSLGAAARATEGRSAGAAGVVGARPRAAFSAERKPVSGAASAKPGAPIGGKSLYGAAPIVLRKPSLVRPSIVAIGSSTGGPQALFKVFEDLAKHVNLPIVITQHMPATFTTILAEHLSSIAGRKCVEGTDGMKVEQGGIYLAPGDYHMTIHGTPDGAKILRLDQNPPVNFCRPAVDPMFSSLAKQYVGAVLAVVLTGMGKDGLDGGRDVVDAGGTVIAQDEASSVVWGMPGAVATNGLCSAVLPIEKISGHVQNLVRGVFT
jgi:two-component system chemotaxis response regulator CheB